MTLGNFLVLICYTEIIICGFILSSGRKMAEKNRSLLCLGLFSILWSGGTSVLALAQSQPMRFVGALVMDTGTLLGLAVLPYHLGRTLGGRQPVFRKIFWGQTALAAVILCLRFFGHRIQAIQPDGYIIYAAHTVVDELTLAYKACAVLLVLVFTLYAGQKAAYRRKRHQARVLFVCSLAGEVLTLASSAVHISYAVGVVVKFAVFLLLCRFAFRYPSTVSPAGITRYVQDHLCSPPFVALAPDNTVQMVNSSGQALLGRDGQRLTGLDIRECVQFLSEYQPIQLHREGNTAVHYDAVTRQGVLCDLEMTYVYDDFEEILCAIILVGDVTSQVQMIHQLEESKRQAEMASNAKSAFLANTSHEIRTPMNAVVGLTELLARAPLPPGAMEYVIGIRQASDSLLSIVNDLLDFSKIESGRMEIVEGEYQLSSLLNDVVSIVRMRLTDRPVLFAANVNSSLPALVRGDEVRMRQVLLNLLNNAVKYTSQGSIIFTVTATPGKGDEMIFSFAVTDTGIGIRPEDMEHLFDDFVRVDTKRNRAVEGTGLGLAISKRLGLAMGGDIRVESEYGKGSTFTFVVPQRVADGAPLAKVEASAGASVLLLESRDIYVQSICATVRGLGVPCWHVRTQAQFFHALRDGAYTFVFTPVAQYDGARRIMERVGAAARLVLLTEFGEIAVPEQSTLPLPAWCVPVAQVLNGAHTQEQHYTDPYTSISFTAPGARVLVVDDMYTNLKVAEGLMAPYQMHVDLCQSGEDAVTMVLTGDYDIVFMDHMMPGMDGVEVTAVIRQQKGRFQTLPIVALTANAVSGVKEMFLACGLDDFLAKPIDTAKLNAVLNLWLPPHKKRRYTGPSLQTAQEPSLVIKGVDTEKGLSIAGGSRARYGETLRVLARETPGRVNHLRRCVQEGAFKEYVVTVHALKGALAAVGAQELSEIARRLEVAGRAGEGDTLTAATEGFLVLLEKLARRIEAVLPREQRPTGVQAGPEDLRGLPDALAALREALSSMDAAEVEKNMARLRRKTWPDQTETLLKNVEARVSVYDYAEARRLLEEN